MLFACCFYLLRADIAIPHQFCCECFVFCRHQRRKPPQRRPLQPNPCQPLPQRRSRPLPALLLQCPLQRRSRPLLLRPSPCSAQVLLRLLQCPLQRRSRPLLLRLSPRQATLLLQRWPKCSWRCSCGASPLQAVPVNPAGVTPAPPPRPCQSTQLQLRVQPRRSPPQRLVPRRSPKQAPSQQSRFSFLQQLLLLPGFPLLQQELSPRAVPAPEAVPVNPAAAQVPSSLPAQPASVAAHLLQGPPPSQVRPVQPRLLRQLRLLLARPPLQRPQPPSQQQLKVLQRALRRLRLPSPRLTL